LPEVRLLGGLVLPPALILHTFNCDPALSALRPRCY